MSASALRKTRRREPVAQGQEGDATPATAQGLESVSPQADFGNPAPSESNSPAPAPSSPEEIVQAAFARLQDISRRFMDSDQETGTDGAAKVGFGRRSEPEWPRAAGALRSLDGALGKLAVPLEEGRDRIRDAVDGVAAQLRQIEADAAPAPSKGPAAVEAYTAPVQPAEAASMAAERRLPTPAVEAGPAVSPIGAAQLEELTKDLTGRIAAAAAELEARLGASLGSRIDGVEHGVTEMAGKLDEADARSRAATEAVRGKVAAIEQSFATAQTAARLNAEAMQRLDGDVTRASRSLDEALASFGQRLGSFGEKQAALEDKLGQLDSGHARTSEALGAEVTRIDQALEAGLGRVEALQAATLERLATEVTRIDQSVDKTLGRVDSLQAETLDKVVGRITRISERLAERIAATDWRSAQAIEEVAERMTQASEHLNQRERRTTADLLARIHISEERTADILKRAVDRLDTLGQPRESVASWQADGAESAFEEAPDPLPQDDDFAAGATIDAHDGFTASAQPFAASASDEAASIGDVGEEPSDFAAPSASSESPWAAASPAPKPSAKGRGLFGLFKSATK
jgi:localization factor PodJL